MKHEPPANVYVPSSAFVKSILPTARRKDGVALAEGERTAMLALEGSWRPRALILETSFAASDAAKPFRRLAEKSRTDVHTFNRAAMEKISSCETAPEVAVLVAPPATKFEDSPSPASRLLVLDRIGDPGNAGTLVRSAAAFGFSTVLTTGSVSLINEKFIRSTAGNCFLPGAVAQAGDSGTLAEFLHGHHFTMLALMPRAEKTLGQINIPASGRVALVLGNETAGVDASAWRRAAAVRIPMQPGVESLNVAMSGAIALYELSRAELS